ncbi:MAG: hypothetical protein WDO74_14315 [Pseudomonadota bacterium]
MKIGKLTLAGLLVLVALPGCGSDDSASPVQKCEDLITRLCESAISCQVKGGVIESSKQASANATCKSNAHNEVDCSKAKRVKSSYDACMSKVSNPPCDEVNEAIATDSLELPSECDGVIEVSSG